MLTTCLSRYKTTLKLIVSWAEQYLASLEHAFQLNPTPETVSSMKVQARLVNSPFVSIKLNNKSSNTENVQASYSRTWHT